MKACFIGLGSIGTRHCQNLALLCREADVSLSLDAVRSSNQPVRESLQPYDIRMLNSFEEMDDEYDMIFITNPTSLHYATMRKVGNKSKHFFIEKPVFEKEDEDITALPLKADALCYVAAPLRYTRVLQDAKKFLTNHKIYCARAISSSYLPNWRAGQDYRTTYSAQKALGGGVAIDLIHEWDYLAMLFGMPQKIDSFSGKYSDLEIDSDDLAVYIAAYPSHLVELHLDYFGKETVRQLELFTQQGCTIFDIAHACVRYPDGSKLELPETSNDKYVSEMKYFLSLVTEKNRTNENTIAHACQVLRLAKGGVV